MWLRCWLVFSGVFLEETTKSVFCATIPGKVKWFSRARWAPPGDESTRISLYIWINLITEPQFKGTTMMQDVLPPCGTVPSQEETNKSTCARLPTAAQDHCSGMWIGAVFTWHRARLSQFTHACEIWEVPQGLHDRTKWAPQQGTSDCFVVSELRSNPPSPQKYTQAGRTQEPTREGAKSLPSFSLTLNCFSAVLQQKISTSSLLRH